MARFNVGDKVRVPDAYGASGGVAMVVYPPGEAIYLDDESSDVAFRGGPVTLGDDVTLIARALYLDDTEIAALEYTIERHRSEDHLGGPDDMTCPCLRAQAIVTRAKGEDPVALDSRGEGT